MAVLTGLEPAKVFQYFEEICAIPHGSYNTKPISDYCARFAEEHGLRYIQDEFNNVIIFKDGTAGYENSAPVILQGHVDMVCEKESDCTIDFEKDGLTLILDEDAGAISAQGTTLGGDDGIAVAYALALLDSDSIPHPPLEVVLTTDEEVGMLGAAAMDCSPLQGRIMLNMDSEDEGYLLVSCAGGATAIARIPVTRATANGFKVTMTINKLKGGHSGVEIHKGRANANQLMGRTLNELRKVVPFQLLSVNGGLKDNAIPRESVAEILIDAPQKAALQAFVAKWQSVYSAEYITTDPDVTLSISAGEAGIFKVMDSQTKRRVIASLVNLPGGVQRMSADIEGLVQTSLNMGILTTSDGEVAMHFAVRSSVSSEKEELLSRVECLIEMLGGTVERYGDYPAWEYNHDSKLRDLMIKIFEKLYWRKPVVQALHAGVECGLFAGKLPGLDCVSFGPDMSDIHTPQESLNIASVERTWKYLLEILKRLK